MKKTAEGKYLRDNAENYDENAYERPSVTVDICICSIIDDALKVLLIKRKYPPYKNHWAIPGGFVDITSKESLEETAKRELEEETSLKDIYIEQLKTYGDHNRDPRMRVITVVYFALIPYSKIGKIIAKDDAKEYQWKDVKDLDVIDLAFDHNKIIKDLVDRLKGKIPYTPIAFSLVNEKFTWYELQTVYEVILDEVLLAPNFRRDISRLYDIKQLDKKATVTTPGKKPVLLQYQGKNPR